MNIYQIVGIFIGTVGGITWEVLGTTAYKQIPTITPSLIIGLASDKNFHLHHWLIYLGILLIVIFVSIKTGRTLHPSVLMIVSFLLGAMSYNFTRFPDWYIFFK